MGKSTILYDLAARVSRGGKHVLVATAEDHLAAVVRPRLEAAGADLSLVDCARPERSSRWPAPTSRRAAHALAYRMMGVELSDEIRTSRIEWVGEAPEVDVRELLNRPDPKERSAREEAIDFLRTSGAMDAAQPVKDLEADARARGISDKTLQRARRALHLAVSRPSFGGPYYWGPMSDSHA